MSRFSVMREDHPRDDSGHACPKPELAQVAIRKGFPRLITFVAVE